MGDQRSAPSGPDLSLGIPAASLAEGAMVSGHVGDEPVLVARVDGELFATDVPGTTPASVSVPAKPCGHPP
ncbi:MAG TPA: hypothetical protein VD930_11205 [Gemmatimonadales bacterium]|nr:hypothetical protein [Gemmatimonadales bacterium]